MAKKPKSLGAASQERFRANMKAQGFVLVTEYVHGDDRQHLKQFAQTLRKHRKPVEAITPNVKDLQSMSTKWTTRELFEQLRKEPYIHDHDIELMLEEGAEPTISARLPQYGDLPVIIVTTDDELRISTVLCHASDVVDTASFNAICLSLNPITSLSNIGTTGTNGDTAYVLFGQLSASSPLPNIVEEIEVLGRNTIEVAHELHDLLKK